MKAVKRGQSRSVTVVYGSVATGLLLVIATVALVLAPPAPPSVAEFAPRSEKQIDEAPRDQSSRFGSGDGACAIGQACEGVGPTTTTTVAGARLRDGRRTTIDKARVRRCVGDPPRQTEDPQSPPCVNYWQGDNGGATWQGVTADEVRIAVNEMYIDGFQELLPHFNNRYELYGRKLRLVAYQGEGKIGAESADELGAFVAVSSNYHGIYETDKGFMEEAARLGMVGGTTDPGDIPGATYDAHGPNLWSYGLPADEMEAATGRFVCSSLAGKPARFAGAQYRAATRKFGILVRQRAQGSRSTTAIRQALARCGVDAKVYETTLPGARLDGLRVDDVTSIIAMTGASDTSNFMTAAANIGYEPEWIVTGTSGIDNETQWMLAPANQRAHLFGITFLNKFLPDRDEPTMWALKEGNPEFESLGLEAYVVKYQTLLLLVSGIQMAGPDLTPETVRRGLWRARFPNPGHGGPPYYQAHVGFGVGDYAMVDDIAVIWWSEAGPGRRNLGEAAGWCWADRGRRYRPDDIPDVEAQLFLADPTRCE